MKVEQIGPEDWRRLKGIRLRALSDTPDAFGETLEQATAHTDKDWKDWLRASDEAAFLVVENNEDVAMAFAAPFEGAIGLFGMWVAPNARGTGVSDELISAVVQWTRKLGQNRLLLEVADTNHAAIKLYERNGFRRNGKTSALPPPRSHIKEHQRERLL